MLIIGKAETGGTVDLRKNKKRMYPGISNKCNNLDIYEITWVSFGTLK